MKPEPYDEMMDRKAERKFKENQIYKIPYYIAGIKEGIRLANEVGLEHFIDNFITGEHHPTCRACKLLKEWGIK